MDWWKIEAQVCTTWVVFQTVGSKGDFGTDFTKLKSCILKISYSSFHWWNQFVLGLVKRYLTLDNFGFYRTFFWLLTGHLLSSRDFLFTFCFWMWKFWNTAFESCVLYVEIFFILLFCPFLESILKNKPKCWSFHHAPLSFGTIEPKCSWKL